MELLRKHWSCLSQTPEYFAICPKFVLFGQRRQRSHCTSPVFSRERSPTGISNAGLEQQGLLALPCILKQPEIHRKFSRSCRGYFWHYLRGWELPSHPWQLGSARMDMELMKFPSQFAWGFFLINHLSAV